MSKFESLDLWPDIAKIVAMAAAALTVFWVISIIQFRSGIVSSYDNVQSALQAMEACEADHGHARSKTVFEKRGETGSVPVRWLVSCSR